MINSLRNRLAYYLINVAKIVAGRRFIVAVYTEVGDLEWSSLEAKKVRANAVSNLINQLEKLL